MDQSRLNLSGHFLALPCDQPAYLNCPPAAMVADILCEAVAHSGHEFWPDSFSLLSPNALHWDRLLSGRHLTDVYLLALAVRNGGRLVTLHKDIPLSAVPKPNIW